MTTSLSIPITVVHRRSGVKKDLVVTQYIKRSYLVRWPMTGNIELKKNKDGFWNSNPRSFFRDWDLVKESQQVLDDQIPLHEAERQKILMKDRGYNR